ncbi:MAG: LysM peptidoglycan-binding domain-containing protein [Bacterioplanes sp.]|nr:LysM peptidoglycan-binding domain-containing protein [Bacterioplanes sp.]
MKFILLSLSSLLFVGCAGKQTVTETQPISPRSEAALIVLDDWQEPTVGEVQFDDVWDRLLANFQLNIDIDHPRVAAEIRWFTRHQSYFDRVADRGQRYLYFIAEQIETRGVPGELALLAIVESAFDPFAYSHGRASGVWQFIPGTGRDFGLEQDWWQDGRRDIRASTEAALSYLNALQREFNGDWMLALAAYNSGAGTVRRAIRNNRNAGKPTDYWSLSLPRETQAYVPKLIALSRILRDQEEHGIRFTPIANEPYFAVVNTGGQIDLSHVAELSDTPLDEIYRLNPGFNRWATHPDGPHEILVPADKAVLFNEQLASLPSSERVRWQRYQVQRGDNLNSIARQFHTTSDALMQANSMRSSVIRAGQELLIPSAFREQGEYSHSVTQRLDRLRAQRQPSNTQRVEHQVRRGDSFWEIARTHDVTVAQLARWNGMAPGDPLRPGQTLVVWTQNTTPANREVIRRINYRVRSGDSLARIAQRFNVRVADLQRWNASQLNHRYLQPGQNLTLYVDVMNK